MKLITKIIASWSFQIHRGLDTPKPGFRADASGVSGALVHFLGRPSGGRYRALNNGIVRCQSHAAMGPLALVAIRGASEVEQKLISKQPTLIKYRPR
ncbi:uncharacterized protein TrAtP1_006700 [Trichoderma atroviride]|uniref:uncharacterized protein n=1 Tax=Hypocrea atroviridis TaxID=63577 RepID=UPI00333493F8|nr:hypothetical protein TrAtP1_006700 [Trichoderma atroviride]